MVNRKSQYNTFGKPFCCLASGRELLLSAFTFFKGISLGMSLPYLACAVLEPRRGKVSATVRGTCSASPCACPPTVG